MYTIFVKGRLDLVISDSDKLDFAEVGDYDEIIEEEIAPLISINEVVCSLSTKEDAIAYALSNKDDEASSSISIASYLEKKSMFCFDTESMLFKGEYLRLSDCRVRFNYDYDLFLDLIIRYLDQGTYTLFRFVSKFAYMKTVDLTRKSNQLVLDVIFREISHLEVLTESDASICRSMEYEESQFYTANKLLNRVNLDDYNGCSLVVKNYFTRYEVYNNKKLKNDLRGCDEVNIHYASMIRCTYKFEFSAYVLAFMNYVIEYYDKREEGLFLGRSKQMMGKYRLFYFLSSISRVCRVRYAKMCALLVNCDRSLLCLNLRYLDPYRNKLLNELCMATRCDPNKCDINANHSMCCVRDGELRFKYNYRVKNHHRNSFCQR